MGRWESLIVFLGLQVIEKLLDLMAARCSMGVRSSASGGFGVRSSCSSLEAEIITEVNAVNIRQNLGEMLNRVQYRNDSIVINRHGKPVAVLVDAELFAHIQRMRDRFDALDVVLSRYILDEMVRVLPRLPRIQMTAAEIRDLADSFMFLADIVEPEGAQDVNLRSICPAYAACFASQLSDHRR